MKTREREEARRLRKEDGESVKEIAKRLRVAASSVSRWVRDIELTAEQHEALCQRSALYNAQMKGRSVVAERCRALRQQWQDEGRALARSGHPFHAAGCMLYWAEGSKDRNVVGLSNSDPEVLRYFLAFLKTFFGVPDEKVRVHCNLFADHIERQEAIEGFWLDALNLPRGCLQKSTVNVYSKYSARKRQNVLPYGTGKLRVCSTRIVQSIYGSIQEYGQFNRPEWLG
jgi:transposase-like protein